MPQAEVEPASAAIGRNILVMYVIAAKAVGFGEKRSSQNSGLMPPRSWPMRSRSPTIWIGEVLAKPEDASTQERVRGQVLELCQQFPAPANP